MRWNGGGHHGVWVHNVRNNEGYHPTEKPQALLREWLIQFTEPDDIILDPWAGSASVGVACIATGRRYVGIEIDERFVATAIRRLEEPPLLMLEA
jgi:site-specific DNA-methyltransferase (adenine-specific)